MGAAIAGKTRGLSKKDTTQRGLIMQWSVYRRQLRRERRSNHGQLTPRIQEPIKTLERVWIDDIGKSAQGKCWLIPLLQRWCIEAEVNFHGLAMPIDIL